MRLPLILTFLFSLAVNATEPGSAHTGQTKSTHPASTERDDGEDDVTDALGKRLDKLPEKKAVANDLLKDVHASILEIAKDGKLPKTTADNIDSYKKAFEKESVTVLDLKRVLKAPDQNKRRLLTRVPAEDLLRLVRALE